MREVMEGLAILLKYGEGEIQADHEVIYAGNEVGADFVSAYDREKLDKLGWFWDDAYDCWSRFV